MNSSTFKLAGDLEVSRLGLGTIHLTTERGFGPARETATDLLKEAVRLGVNFIDTADSYGPETAEHVLCEALYPYPEGLVIATKGGYLHQTVDDWREVGRPEHLIKACEGSLRRLKIDCVDLYQMHVPDPDPNVPYVESIGALKKLQERGMIRHIGVSRVTRTHLEEACREVNVVSVQNAFNVAYTENEEVLRFCEKKGIAFIPWMPLADKQLPLDYYPVAKVARKHGATFAQVMLVALLHLSDVMIPIPGTGSINHLRENIAAVNVNLDKEDLQDLWPGLFPQSL